MSYADERFIQNCRDILTNGVWDTELEVRPHWEDGTPAHTVKKFGIINRYDLREEFPILTLRRTYFKTCIDELLWIWQQKSNNIHDLGQLGRRYRLHRQGLRLSAGGEAPVSGGGVRSGGSGAVRPEAQPRQPPHHDQYL